MHLSLLKEMGKGRQAGEQEGRKHTMYLLVWLFLPGPVWSHVCVQADALPCWSAGGGAGEAVIGTSCALT